MEAEETNTVNADPAGSLDMERNTEALVTELSQVLADLEASPQNVPLLRRQVMIMRQLDMVTESLDCILRLNSLIMIGEGETYFINRCLSQSKTCGSAFSTCYCNSQSNPSISTHSLGSSRDLTKQKEIIFVSPSCKET